MRASRPWQRKQLDSLGGQIKTLHGQFEEETLEEKKFRQTLDFMVRLQPPVEQT